VYFLDLKAPVEHICYVRSFAKTGLIEQQIVSSEIMLISSFFWKDIDLSKYA